MPHSDKYKCFEWLTFRTELLFPLRFCIIIAGKKRRLNEWERKKKNNQHKSFESMAFDWLDEYDTSGNEAKWCKRMRFYGESINVQIWPKTKLIRALVYRVAWVKKSVTWEMYRSNRHFNFLLCMYWLHVFLLTMSYSCKIARA